LKEPEGDRVDAPQQLNLLCYCPVSTRGGAYMWEEYNSDVVAHRKKDSLQINL